MIINKQPQYLQSVYNPIDTIIDNQSAFNAIISEIVIRTYGEDFTNAIRRLNIYNDNTIRFNLSDIISAYIPRIKQSYTFNHNQLSLINSVLSYLQLINTDGIGAPLIINWKYVFNGSIDRNINIELNPDTLLNKPLLNNKQHFINQQYGHLNIFNGQYDENNKNTFEYINILNDKLNNNNNTEIYNVNSINSFNQSLTVYDGYLYSWYLANLNINGTYAIINYQQPNDINTWRIPENDDWIYLREFLCPAIAGSGLFGGNNNANNLAGQFLKADSVWTANTGDNNYYFNAFPTGLRTSSPSTEFFNGFTGTSANTRASYISLTQLDYDNVWIPQLDSTNQNLNIFGSNQSNKHWGYSVRLVRDAVDGDLDYNPNGYVGNNGITYPTVKIGNLIWLATNLVETRWSINEFNSLYSPSNLTWESAFEKYCVYNITSNDTICVDEDFFAFPCLMDEPFYGNDNLVNVNFTFIDNPQLITNKLYRYVNQNYESSDYFPTTKLHIDDNSQVLLTSIDNGFNKMISNPCYPNSMRNVIGFIENESVVTISVNDITRFKVGDIIILRFKETSTLSLSKLSMLSQSFVISNIIDNKIITNQQITIDNYDRDNLKCVVLATDWSSLLLEVDRKVIPAIIDYEDRTINSETKRVLTVSFVNLNQNLTLPYSFIQLLSTNEGLLNVFGDLKIKLDGIRQRGNTVKYYSTKVVDNNLRDWIDDINNSKAVNIIEPNGIVYDEVIDYNTQYSIYTSKWLINNNIEDDNLYEKELSDYIEFNLFDNCGKFDIVQLGYLNEYGAVEYFLFNKKKVNSRDITRLSMRKPLEIGNRNKYDEELYNYNTKVEYNTALDSDWLSENDYNRCLELLESTKVFEVMDGYELPIVVRNTNVIERNNLNDKLYSITVEYTRTYNKIMQR